LEYAVSEQTQAGEKYLYVPIRAVKPQEGGLGQVLASISKLIH
jgi:hypothetical protein